MKTNGLFLQEDKEREEKELNCCGYCINNANQHYRHTEFEKAAVYHENIARSLRELQSMKNKKEMMDGAWLMLKQMESDQQQEQLLNELRSRI